MSDHNASSKIGTWAGFALVVANMIGTGAFTSLGFQLQELSDHRAVLILWVLGGLVALAGALSYAEVGTAIKRSGGEYAFLSHIYHPLAGYLSGWVSITVGFAAPVALSAMAVVQYLPIADLHLRWTSIGLVAAITLVHTFSLRTSARFQSISTILKLLFIVAFITIGLALPAVTSLAHAPSPFFLQLASPAFAVALFYVSYAYSGWNAAIYITEEFKDSTRSLPIALVGGTLLVMLLYTLLQYVFLVHAPLGTLTGQIDVGSIVAQEMLGVRAGSVFGASIALLLISGISAMVWAGSRVTATIAHDIPLWRPLRSAAGTIPRKALWTQFAITSLFLLSGTFEEVLIYCGMLLTLSSMLTVLGVFFLRRNGEHLRTGAFSSPLFPLFPVVYLLFSTGMIVFAAMRTPLESTVGASTLVIGFATWKLNEKMKSQQPA
jgi:APA family basic amino acid/polyamine antiporter